MSAIMKILCHVKNLSVSVHRPRTEGSSAGSLRQKEYKKSIFLKI